MNEEVKQEVQQEAQQVSENKQNKKKRGLTVLVLLLLLLVITVGYSVLSTTLNINGTSQISVPSWDVHFQNLAVTSGSVSGTQVTTPAAIQTGNTTINYSVTLAQPGEFYEFTVQVKNFGSIDAKLDSTNPITLGGVSSAQDVYVNYTVKYSDGTTPAANDELNANAVKTYRVRVEFDPSINASQLPTTAQTLNLTCSINYVQA